MRTLRWLGVICVIAMGCEYKTHEAVGPSAVSAPLTSTAQRTETWLDAADSDIHWMDSAANQVAFLRGWAQYSSAQTARQTAQVRKAAKEVAQQATARVAQARGTVKATAKKAVRAAQKVAMDVKTTVKSMREAATPQAREAIKPAAPSVAAPPQPLPVAPNDWWATVTDKYLTEDLRAAISQDPLLTVAAPGVQIHTEYGAVTLTGRVPSDFVRQELVKRVTERAGVTAVFDQLEVR